MVVYENYYFKVSQIEINVYLVNSLLNYYNKSFYDVHVPCKILKKYGFNVENKKKIGKIKYHPICTTLSKT